MPLLRVFIVDIGTYFRWLQSVEALRTSFEDVYFGRFDQFKYFIYWLVSSIQISNISIHTQHTWYKLPPGKHTHKEPTTESPEECWPSKHTISQHSKRKEHANQQHENKLNLLHKKRPNLLPRTWKKKISNVPSAWNFLCTHSSCLAGTPFATCALTAYHFPSSWVNVVHYAEVRWEAAIHWRRARFIISLGVCCVSWRAARGTGIWIVWERYSSLLRGEIAIWKI